VARDLTHAEWRAFVLEGTRTAKLAVTRADGRPHVTPVCVVLDGDDVLFNTATEGLKGKAIRRDPRVSVLFDDERAPYAFVLITGEAELSDDLEQVRAVATEVGRRYFGDDRAEEFGARNGVPGELAVRVRVTKVVAKSGIAE
jgi:PPOX class probable F420-dependent enzyme